jgi:hypothetical protein
MESKPSHSRAVGVGRGSSATRTSRASRSCSRPELPSTKAHTRIKKGSRSAVTNLRTAWKKREEELQIPTQNTARVLVEAHLSLPVIVPHEQATTETNAPEIEARTQAKLESSSERGDSVPGHVSEDALRALQGARGGRRDGLRAESAARATTRSSRASGTEFSLSSPSRGEKEAESRFTARPGP